MQEKTDKRKWTTHVRFNRLEVNDAQAKMKDLGFKTLPQLARHAIEVLDTSHVVRVQELEKRVRELGLEVATAEYWVNYGTRWVSEKDELTEQLLKETQRYEILEKEVCTLRYNLGEAVRKMSVWRFIKFMLWCRKTEKDNE